jgi:hypothetical protein
VLTDEQVEELRLWARGLEMDERAEIRAAARAICLLADDLQASRSQLLEERLVTQALEARERSAEGEEQAAALRDLARRLKARLALRKTSEA